MSRIFALAAACCLFLQCAQSPSVDEPTGLEPEVLSSTIDSGWIELFDGKSLTGWHSYGNSSPGASWDVQDGAIHLKKGPRNGYQTLDGGDLVTDESYSDFLFEIEWKISKGGNSGILFYVQDEPEKYKETWYTGMELQVCDNKWNVDANVNLRDAGHVYDLVAADSMVAKGHGEWNRVQMSSRSGKVEVVLNGMKNLAFSMTDSTWQKRIAGSKFKDMPGFGAFKSGHIALQDHGEEVWFRNVRIKKL